MSQYISDVERTPFFLDQKYALDGVKFEQGANKVTDKGLQTIQNEADAFRGRYIGSLLAEEYDPLEVYVRAQYENVPISGAYAFMLSLYPDTADGLDLMKGFVAIDKSNLPITSDELNGLRSRLGLGVPSADKQNVDVYPGNPDLLFHQGVAKNFPNWKPVLDEMRKSSLTQFEGKFPDFFVDIRKALGKEGDSSNILFYLDFYNQAVANGQYQALTGELADQEKEYFKALFPQKESYTRVLANAYLKHIVNLMNLKQ